MYLEEMSFAIEAMFTGIIGGKDYLLQASVDSETGEQRPDAQIIMWELPIEQPTQEQLKDFFSQVEDEYRKVMGQTQELVSEEERRKKIVSNFLGDYGN